MSMRITVIGAGPGGYTAAFEAARRGAAVTMIESGSLGGTCLNCGCIPTKTVRTSAEAFELLHRASEFGISAGPARIVLSGVLQRKRRVVDILRSGLEKTCCERKVRLLNGRGRVLDAHAVEIVRPDGTTEVVNGDALVIATGSTSLALPALPVDNGHVFASEGALELSRLPERLLIVGGGVIGCELACIYAEFGSRVTVVEGQKRLLPVPSVDDEMSRILQREMKKRKVTVERCRTVTAVEQGEDGVRAHLGPSPFVAEVSEAARRPARIDCDAIFVTAGRTPNTAGLGLAEAGIQVDRRGYICVGDTLETSRRGIYAVGDVLGPRHVMLAHMAAAEGLIAVENILGGQRSVSYGVVPAGIFTNPEIADVGLTEEQARVQGMDVTTAQFQFRELGKAQAMGELPGVFKLVAEKGSGRLLGVHIAGAHATELIAEAALALRAGLAVRDIASTIHAHPTLAEGMYEAARQLANR